MRRPTSTASSSRRASPSTASSRRAPRSRSVSWRSHRDWGWQHELGLPRPGVGAVPGAFSPTRGRGASQAAPAAGTRRGVPGSHRRSDGRLLRGTRDLSRGERGEVRAGGRRRQHARRARAAHPDRGRSRGPDRRQRRRRRPGGGRLSRARRHRPFAARALCRTDPGWTRPPAAARCCRVRDCGHGVRRPRRIQAGARRRPPCRVRGLGRPGADSRLSPGPVRLLAARLPVDVDRRPARLAARRRSAPAPDREARQPARRRRAPAHRTGRRERRDLAPDGDPPDCPLDDRAPGRRSLANAHPRRMTHLSAERTDMRDEKSAIARGGVLAILALALLAAALTGCGVGNATDEEKINKTASTYLSALADGDTAKACAQLTSRARGERCEPAMKERLPRLDTDALKDAADGSIDVDIDDDRATAGLSEPEGARFLLAKVGAEWRIDSGYTLG